MLNAMKAKCRGNVAWFGWPMAILAIQVAVGVTPTHAQNNPGNNNFFGQAVGGVSIDADGVLQNSSVDAMGRLREMRLDALGQEPGNLNESSPLRKISLRRLEAEIDRHLAAGEPLPPAIQLLAGLQRVQFVFVDPDASDIILAGPAEPWMVSPHGELVGVRSGRPAIHLDDLLVALRTTAGTVRSPISCSIDPTPQGLQQLQAFMNKGRKRMGPAVVAGIERSLGPQTIRVDGISPTTHFARVLVAADYRMKRLAMDFEEAPLAGMPSFLDLMKSSRAAASNMMPRWWLTTDYEPLLRDEEGTAWELRGPGVRAMAEEDYFSAAGVRQRSAKASPLAQRWADSLTSNFDVLANRLGIFGQLRNCMDLAVVAALITKYDLTAKAGLDMPNLTSAERLPEVDLPAPSQVDSKASFVKRGREWIVSASGGVQLNPWEVVERSETSASLAGVQREATDSAGGDSWWWD